MFTCWHAYRHSYSFSHFCTLIRFPKLTGVAVLYLALMVFLTGLQVKAYRRLVFLTNSTIVTNKYGRTAIKDIKEIEELSNFVLGIIMYNVGHFVFFD